MWRLRLSAARTGRSQRESGRCPAARGPQPGAVQQGRRRRQQRQTMRTTAIPCVRRACGRRAPEGRSPSAASCAAPELSPCVTGASRLARRAFRLMCLLDTFRTPSPCSHVPLALPQAWCCDSILRIPSPRTSGFTNVYPRRSKRAPRRKPTLKPPPCLCATRPSWPPVLPAARRGRDAPLRGARGQTCRR